MPAARGYAQGETDHWFLPPTLHTSFAANGPVEQPDIPFRIFGKNASISDSIGKLLFVTGRSANYNRSIIYDGNYKPLPFFEKDNNASAEYDFYFLQNPANAMQYYFFYIGDYSYNTGLAVVKYGIIDLSLNNGRGDVTQFNIKVDSAVGTSFVPVQKSGDDFWVITSHIRDKKFRAWQVNASGIAAKPIISDIAAGEPERKTNLYNLKASPNGKLIAGLGLYNVPDPQFPYSVRYATVFDVNQATGMVSYRIKTPNEANIYFGASDLAFSPDSRLLYVNWQFDVDGLQPCDFSGSNFRQYNLCYTDSDQLARYAPMVHTVFNFCGVKYFYGDLQLGADKKLYTPYTKQTTVSSFQQPNHIGTSSGFLVETPGIKNEYLGSLPNFYHYYIAKAVISNIVYKGACFGSPMQFSISNDTIAAIHWNFGDAASGANTSTLLQPSHTFSKLGIYTVTADLFNNNHVLIETVTDQVEVKDPARRLLTGLPKDTTICQGDVVPVNLSVINGFYYWTYWYKKQSLEEAGISDSFDIGSWGEGMYYVEMHQNDCDGCILIDSINVHTLRKPSFSLGDDRNLCSGDSLHLSVYANDAAIWWSTGAATDNIWVKKEGQYWAAEEYDHNGCITRDTITLTAAPDVRFSFSKDTILCNNEKLVL